MPDKTNEENKNPEEKKSKDPKKEENIIPGNDVLKEFQNEINKMNQGVTTLNADIASLNEIKDDITPKVSDYRNACKGFKDRRKTIEQYSTDKTPMIAAGIKDNKASVDQIIKENDTKIQEKQKEVTDLETQKKECEVQTETARNVKNNEKSAYSSVYEELSRFEDKIDKNLTDLEKYINEIESFENAKIETGKMYFLMSVVNDLLGKTIIEKPEDFESKLYDTWKKFHSAEEDLRNKEENLNKLNEDLKKKKGELKNLQDNRVQEILDKIDEMNN